MDRAVGVASHRRVMGNRGPVGDAPGDMGIRAGQPAVMPGAGYSPVSTGLSGSIVGAAGLVPALRLAEAAGLHDLIEEHLGVPSSNPAAKATSVVAGMLAGADSIDDPDLLRHGGMPRLFTQVRAPSTLGRRPGPFQAVQQVLPLGARRGGHASIVLLDTPAGVRCDRHPPVAARREADGRGAPGGSGHPPLGALPCDVRRWSELTIANWLLPCDARMATDGRGLVSAGEEWGDVGVSAREYRSTGAFAAADAGLLAFLGRDLPAAAWPYPGQPLT